MLDQITLVLPATLVNTTECCLPLFASFLGIYLILSLDVYVKAVRPDFITQNVTFCESNVLGTSIKRGRNE